MSSHAPLARRLGSSTATDSGLRAELRATNGTLVICEPVLRKPFEQTPLEMEGLAIEEQELLRAFAERKSTLLAPERNALARDLRNHLGARLQARGQSTQALDDWLD